MNCEFGFCTVCSNRADACADCHEAKLAAKEKYIEAQDVIISGQRKEIARLEAEIVELKKLNNRLQDHILKDSCPWCGLNNKSNVKRQATEAEGNKP